MSTRRIETGSWVYDPDYDMMVPKAVRQMARRNYFDEKRSDLPSPAIRPDGMPPIKSMTDGRIHDGKSAYYKSVYRAGCEIVGYDRDWQRHIKPPMPSDKQLEADIGRDICKAWEIEQSKVPSYGPAARRLMRKQRRAERATKA